jgi:transcriptional regulator with XRE-family HTH domain
VNTFEELWKKLARTKEYREHFVASQVKRGIPFQIRALMKKKELNQDKLAELAKLTQGVVSRAANPNYGNLTLNTIIRIAAGFDVAFIGKFVPFSELGKWLINLSEEEAGQVSTFEEENEAFKEKKVSKSRKVVRVAGTVRELQLNLFDDAGNASHQFSLPELSRNNIVHFRPPTLPTVPNMQQSNNNGQIDATLGGRVNAEGTLIGLSARAAVGGR